MHAHLIGFALNNKSSYMDAWWSMGLCRNFALTPFTQYHLVDLLLTFCHAILRMFVQRIWFWINFFPCWCFSLFFSLACLVDCKEKFCLGHSWELSNYWFFFRFLVALFPVSRLIKVWYEEPFLFIITSMNVRVPILLLSQLIEYIVTKLFLSQDDYILFPYEPLVYWVRTDQMEWLRAS